MITEIEIRVIEKDDKCVAMTQSKTIFSSENQYHAHIVYNAICSLMDPTHYDQH